MQFPDPVTLKFPHYRPGEAITDPMKLRLPEFLDNRLKKVERLSALSTGRLYPPKGTSLDRVL